MTINFFNKFIEISSKKQLRFSLTEQTSSDAESGVFSEDEMRLDGLGYRAPINEGLL